MKTMVYEVGTGWKIVETVGHLKGDGNGHIQDFITVTPELARLFLSKNVNRRIKKVKVEQMRRDMRSGNWKTVSDQLAFSFEGDLKNGQHRLTALIEEGVSLKFSVIYGCTDEDMAKIDCGTSRSLYDVYKINARSNQEEGELEKFGVSISTFVRRQTITNMPRKATRDEEMKFIEEYAEIFAWAESIFRAPDLKKPAVSWNVGNDIGAAFARAYLYYKDNPSKLDRLETLAKALVNEDIYDLLKASKKPEDSAFACYVHYLANPNKFIKSHNKQDQNARTDRYRKTEKAIALFVDKTYIKILRDEKEWEERFPLPCELEGK